MTWHDYYWGAIIVYGFIFVVILLYRSNIEGD